LADSLRGVSTRHFKRDGGGLAAERGGASGYLGGVQRVSGNMERGAGMGAGAVVRRVLDKGIIVTNSR
jgi:hypothetical protein